MNGDVMSGGGGGRMPRAVMNRLRLGAGGREDNSDRNGYDQTERMCHERSPSHRPYNTEIRSLMRRRAKKVNERRGVSNRFGGEKARGPDKFVLRREKGEFARACRRGGGHDRVNRRRRARQRVGRRARFEPVMKKQRCEQVAGAVDR